MLDTLIVGAIILAATIYVGRRLYRQFSSKGTAGGCSGCGQSSTCGGIQSSPDTSACSSNK